MNNENKSQLVNHPKTLYSAKVVNCEQIVNK